MQDALIQQLLLAPALNRLMGMQWSTDDLLDIVRLHENQHSDVQGWILDPRQGHGQGDQILRDLLLAAASVAGGHAALDQGGWTARFFAHWTPARIQTTSFRTAFTVREHALPNAQRLDLLVIDPINKLVVVLENKAGSAHTDAQLTGYVTEVNNAYLTAPHLKGFRCAFLALDRAYDGASRKPRKQGSQWIHLGYDWLKPAAERSAREIERGNASAKLVMSYCIRQTDWENPQRRLAMALAGQLHIDHAPAVRALLSHAAGGSLVKRWLDGTASSLASFFLLQNEGVMKLLAQTQGFKAFEAVLAVQLPGVNPEYVEADGDRYVAVCPPALERFDFQDLMPLYVEATPLAGVDGVYQLHLRCERDVANPLQMDELDDIAARIHPSLGHEDAVQVEGHLQGGPAVVAAIKRWYSHMDMAAGQPRLA